MPSGSRRWLQALAAHEPSSASTLAEDGVRVSAAALPHHASVIDAVERERACNAEERASRGGRGGMPRRAQTAEAEREHHKSSLPRARDTAASTAENAAL